MQKTSVLTRKHSAPKKSIAISVAAFDKKVDDGEDIAAHLDLSTARIVEPKMQKVNVDFPQPVIDDLDREAVRIGVPRQSLIKVWIVERLDSTHAERAARLAVKLPV